MDLTAFYEKAKTIEEKKSLDWIKQKLDKLTVDEKIAWIDGNLFLNNSKISTFVHAESETFFVGCDIAKSVLAVEVALFLIYHNQLISKDNPGKAPKILGIPPFLIIE